MYAHRPRRSGPGRVAVAALGALACMIPGRLAAQARDAAALSLDSLLNVKVEAASRHEQHAWDAPSSVTIITAEEIRRHGYRTLEDALAQVPGLWVSNDRNYGAVGVRGFSRPSDYNNRILLLLDGHPINDGVYGQAQTGTELALNLHILDRIEVVRGPGSALYGDNAMFAVVNLVTRAPSSLSGVAMDVAAGTPSQRHGVVLAGADPNPNVSLLAMGEWSVDDGTDYLLGSDVYDGLDGDEYRGAFAELAAGPVKLRMRRSERWKHIPTASWGTDPGDARLRTFDAWSLLDASVTMRPDARLQIETSAAYDLYEYLGYYPYEG